MRNYEAIAAIRNNSVVLNMELTKLTIAFEKECMASNVPVNIRNRLISDLRQARKKGDAHYLELFNQQVRPLFAQHRGAFAETINILGLIDRTHKRCEHCDHINEAKSKFCIKCAHKF